MRLSNLKNMWEKIQTRWNITNKIDLLDSNLTEMNFTLRNKIENMEKIVIQKIYDIEHKISNYENVRRNLSELEEKGDAN